MELIELKTTDVKILREELLREQDGLCAVSGIEIQDGDAVLDHQHKLFKDEVIGENGAGLVRGVLDFRVNAWEGKVFNSYRRLGLHKIGDLPTLLRGLADYLEQENLPYIHPTEVPKPKKFGKRLFNALNKLYKEKYPNRKELEYPKSGKLTKKFEELLGEFGLES